MQKDINFYSGLKDIKQKQSVSPAIVLLSLLIVVSAGLIFAAVYAMKTVNETVLSEADTVHAFLIKPDYKVLAEDTLTKKAIVGLYEQYNSITAEAYSNFYKLPIINSTGFKQITASMPEDMKLLTFDFQLGGVVMNCQCKNETSPPIFVNAVKKTGLFTNVSYSGYSLGEKGEILFTITCVQKGGDR